MPFTRIIFAVVVLAMLALSTANINNFIAKNGQLRKASWAAMYDNATDSSTLLNVPPRRMWGWDPADSGYCGETATQSAALYFGNYVSQQVVRDVATGGNDQFLIAVSDTTAAKQLKLTSDEFAYKKEKKPQAKSYLAFLKKHLDMGHPVVAGFFEKAPNRDAGDKNYDHIMIVIGYTVDADGNMENLYINDFYEKYTRLEAIKGKTRKQCKASTDPEQPFKYCITSPVNYGMAISGNLDKNDELYRAQLFAPWHEPDDGIEDKVNAAPVEMSMTLVVKGLTVGSNISCVRFDSHKNVPSKNFLSSKKWTKRWDFTATKTSYKIMVDPIMSNTEAYYRCVDNDDNGSTTPSSTRAPVTPVFDSDVAADAIDVADTSADDSSDDDETNM